MTSEAQEALKDRILAESQAAHEGSIETPVAEPFALELRKDPEGMTYAVKEDFRPIARALVQKFEESTLKGARGQADEIIFVVNSSDKPKKNGSPRLATIAKIPSKFSDIIWQITGHHFTYILTYYSAWMPAANENQVVAVLYHELRHIDGMGGVREHDINDFAEMYHKLGPNWHAVEQLPDLRAPGVNWDNIVIPVLLPEPTDPQIEIRDGQGNVARGSLRSLKRKVEEMVGRRA